MLVTFASGVLILIAVLFGVVATFHFFGGREFGGQSWQTYVCMIAAAGIAGLLMLPVARFWRRRILR